MSLSNRWRQTFDHTPPDQTFCDENERLFRYGLKIVGLIGIVLPTILVVFYVAILGLKPSWQGAPGVSTAIWDELLISCCAAGLLLVSMSSIRARHLPKWFALFFWLAVATILLDDLIQSGSIHSTNYLALLVLATIGTIPCRAIEMLTLGLGMVAIYLVLIVVWPAPLDPNHFIYLLAQTLLAVWIAGLLSAYRRGHFEAAQQIAASEQKYRSLFRNASDAIFVIDSQTGCFREVNPTLERLLGATAEELERIPFERVIHPMDRERVLGYHLARLRGDPAPERYQLRILSPTTAEEHVCDIAVHRSGDPGVTAGVVRDLTERVRAEETIRTYARELEDTNHELHETQMRLVHAEKAAALTGLVAGVVHELNSPLAVIRSNADITARAIDHISSQLAAPESPTTDRSAALKRCCQALGQASHGTKESVKRISQLVTTFKSFAHLDESEVKGLDLNEAISDTLVLLRQLAPPDVTIATNLGPLPAYYCIGHDISQVVASLIKRALQVVPEGGEVTIATCVRAESIQLSVKNSGAPLSQERIHRLFDPRFAVTDDRVSLGLELPIALQAIAAHGGSVDVTSDEASGTTIKVALPLHHFKK